MPDEAWDSPRQEETAYQVGLKIKLNIIYFDRRSSFLVAALRLEKVIIVGGMLAIVGFVKKFTPEWLTYLCTAFTSAVTVLLLVQNYEEQQRECQEQALKWRHADKKFEELGGNAMPEKSLQEMRKQIAEIQVEGGPVNYARRRAAHNEILQQINAPYRIKQSWHAREFAQFWDFDRDSPTEQVPFKQYFVDGPGPDVAKTSG